MMSVIAIKDLTPDQIEAFKQDRRRLQTEINKDLSWKEYFLELLKERGKR